MAYSLRESFNKTKAPFKEWHMDKKVLILKNLHQMEFFYNRMSASSH